MKPLSLTLKRFGPFVSHTVDFEPFRDAGLFLIHGDTGAGKSTLLDAMSYALFGKGLGVRTGDEMLRDRAAAPSEPTLVALTFALGERVFRATRGMEPSRASASTKATLECLHGDPAYEGVSGARKVNAAVEALLGIGHEQFARIIVLPQGAFRDLLLARAEEREVLLARLFGSQLYELIEARLHKLAQQTEDEERDARATITRTLSLYGAPTPEALEAAASEARSEHRALVDGIAAIERRSDALADELRRATSARELTRRVEAGRAAVERATGGASLEALRGRIARLEVAARCVDLSDLAELREREAQRAESARDEAARQLAERLDERRDQALTPEAIATQDAEINELQRDCEALEAARRSLARDAQRRRDLGARRDELAQTEAALERAQRASAELIDARTRREAEQTNERDALDQAESAAARRVDALELRLRCAKQRELAEERVRGARRALRDSERRERDAGAEVDALEARLAEAERAARDDMAVSLARTLVEGAPCAVCGSTVHPSPRRTTDHRGDGDVEALRHALVEPRRRRDAAREEVARLSGAHRAALEHLERAREEEHEESSSLEDALERARTELRDAQRRRAELDAAHRALDASSEMIARFNEELTAGARKRAELIATIEVLEAHLREAQEHDAEGIDERADALQRRLADQVARREDALRARAELDAVIPVLRRELERASAAAAAQRADADASALHLREAMSAGGFDELSSTRAELGDAGLLTALRAGLVEAERVTSELASLRAGLPPDGVELAARADALEAESAELRRSLQEQSVACGRSESRAAALGDALERVRVELESSAGREARWRAVRSVAAVVTGRTAGRTRLTRFVLLDAFDRVLDCASARLETMSDGRFALRRRDARLVGREFELAVTDAYHGGERAVASLSGGEMFLASLALALGLSDVLQATAGGTRVESLFVDEGFGALDEDALDRAVAVLEHLRAHDRLVGVVSHVAAMRRRIPARLQVIRTDAGSITRSAIRIHHPAAEQAKP